MDAKNTIQELKEELLKKEFLLNKRHSLESELGIYKATARNAEKELIELKVVVNQYEDEIKGLTTQLNIAQLNKDALAADMKSKEDSRLSDLHN